MKKYLFAALGAGLLMTSCQSDEPFAPGNGTAQQVAFTVSLPDAVSTRAAGGTNSAAGGVSNNINADVTFNVALYLGENLVYAHKQTVSSTGNHTSPTFEPTLVIGEQYRVVAYAKFDDDTLNEELTAINVTSEINNEQKDEYFANTIVTAAPELSATLKRPFGKLRLIAEDLLEAERQYGEEITNVEVTYQYTRPAVFNAYAELSATDNVYGKFGDYDMTRPQTLSAAYGEYEADTNDSRTIFVDYLPVDLGEQMVPFTVKVTFSNGREYTRDFRQDIPVKRNHLTTLKGRLFTIDSDLTLTIEENFEGETLIDYVSSAKELQQTIDAAEEGKETVIYLGTDIVGDVTILQKEGVNLVIDGMGYKWDGTATINGDARSKGAETLKFKNINFETKSAKTFIDAPTKINNRYNYSHNVTVENCTFSSASFSESIVGVKLLTTYNAVIKGCTAKNIHSLVQFQSTDNAAVIENVKVENCKNGISLGNIASATITNAEISAIGYGVRLDGEKSRAVAVTISGAEINAFIPVNVRKMNNDACKATVKLEGTNTLVGDTYEIAFCSNEYEEGVAPEAPKGTFTLDGAEGFRAYFGPVNSASAFDAAINSGDEPVIEVTAPIVSVGTGFQVERDVVFDFNDNELNAGSDANSRWYALEIYEKNVEIKNANFTRAGVYAANGADVVFTNGVINHKPERSSRYIFCAQSGSTITINGGTFNNDRQNNAYFWADNSVIYVKGGNFGGVASKNKVVLSNGGQLVITGGTFNFDPTEWVAAGYKATKNGSTWTVTKE